jgi:hypothetical protein
MKKLIAIIFILFSFSAIAQQVVPRSNGSITIQDYRSYPKYNLFVPTYDDTIAANTGTNPGLNLVGAIIFTTTDQNFWGRKALSGTTGLYWSSLGGGAANARNALNVNNGFVEIGGAATKLDSIFIGSQDFPPSYPFSIAEHPNNANALTVDFSQTGAGGVTAGAVTLTNKDFSGVGFGFIGLDPGFVRDQVENTTTPTDPGGCCGGYRSTAVGFAAKLTYANMVSQWFMGVENNGFADSALMIRCTGRNIQFAVDNNGSFWFKGSASNMTSVYGGFMGVSNGTGRFGVGTTTPGQKLTVIGSGSFTDSLSIWTPVSVSGNDSVLVKSGNLVKAIVQSSITGVNIYSADGTLSANRTLTGAANSLIFSGLGGFKFDQQPVVQVNSTNVSGTTINSSLDLSNSNLTTGTGFYNVGNALTTGVLEQISTTSTTLAAGNRLLELSMSGANGTNAITANALLVSVINTNATSGTNTAAIFKASGATTANWAVFTGSVTGGDGRINVNNATNVANQVIVIKSLTNTAGDGIVIKSNNETSNMQIGYQTIATNGGMILNSSATGVQVQSRLYVGASGTSPTALIHILGGTTSANSAPIKLTSGTSMSTAEAGSFEYTTPQLFFTNGGAQRQELFQGQQSRVSTQFDKANATLADITGLTATLVAGKTYRFETVLYTTSNVASGVKFAIAGTATATNIIYEAVVIDANVNAAQTRATGLATTVGAVTAVTNALCKITGTITVNAAGTLTVQFADNAGVNTSSVLVGSTFVVTEML